MVSPQPNILPFRTIPVQYPYNIVIFYISYVSPWLQLPANILFPNRSPAPAEGGQNTDLTMERILDALVELLDAAIASKNKQTKKDTARFVRECLPEVKKSLEG